MSWLSKRVAAQAAQVVTRPRATTVPTRYLPLHKYLHDRYANSVTLTFAQIEDLIGSVLPDLARLQPEWWANPDADGTPSDQARSWVEASRTATANLMSKVVLFERVP